MVRSEDEIKSQSTMLEGLTAENSALLKIKTEHAQILDNSSAIKDKKQKIRDLKKEINNLAGKLREKKVRNLNQEKQIQLLHENVIGF
jgi:hypothetical protein